ncbi:ATP-binding cassette domain-containing protein, partial [Streptococcus pyogenes]
MPYRRQVSYCFQQPVLFGQSVRDNMVFPFEIRELAFEQDKVLKALSRLNLGPEFLEKPIKDLSGGEKQRV